MQLFSYNSEFLEPYICLYLPKFANSHRNHGHCVRWSVSLTETGPTMHIISNTGQTSTTSFANTLKPVTTQHKPIPLKHIAYLHGEPRVVWEEEEVAQMIINEDLQYAVIGKFSYRWPQKIDT
ncbi:hypothetical protein H5410_060788 [Solanum commersonii]|uniref:Uncharacterized protein n=1 Tax=Solanum commersonii TaxID=4109 RepID=A0A9J5W7L8_SOLCO|nr:hypothetical protein H5410_060788 [Solanum commersonii]